MQNSKSQAGTNDQQCNEVEVASSVHHHNAKPIVSGSLPRTEAEIRSASNAIYNNKNLTYSYREDVIAVLDWVLGGEPFDGLDGQ